MANTQPKRNQTSFGLFLMERREQFVNELKQRGIEKPKIAQVSTLASEKWNEMSLEERGPWEAKYRLAKEQYEKDLEEFKKGGGVVEKKTKKDVKAGKVEKDPEKPKRAQTAYSIFFTDKVEEKKPTGQKIPEIAKEAGKLWKEMSEEQKKPYEERAKEMAEKQKTAMEEYKQKKSAAAEEAKKEKQSEETENKGGKAAAKRKASTPNNATEGKQPSAKRGRQAKSGGETTSEKIEVDAEVLKEAQTLGYESKLLDLLQRPKVKDAGRDAKDALEALKSSGGLIHPAIQALLGA